METVMDDKNPDARTIAEEAVGEIRGAPIPEPAKDQAVAPTEDVVRQLATSVGPRSGMAARTAEAVGERVGDAYADGTMTEATARSRNIVRPVWSRASGAAEQPFMAVAAGFALGYVPPRY
jgi:hypothetical protein